MDLKKLKMVVISLFKILKPSYIRKGLLKKLKTSPFFFRIFYTTYIKIVYEFYIHIIYPISIKVVLPFYSKVFNKVSDKVFDKVSAKVSHYWFKLPFFYRFIIITMVIVLYFGYFIYFYFF
jgi:hypothetical protein